MRYSRLAKGVQDLNFLRQASRIFPAGAHAHRHARIRAGRGVRAMAHVSSAGDQIP